MKKKRHVIIGNSAAALSAVKAIRRRDKKGFITLVSAEKHYAYSPVLLPYYISKKINRNALFLTNKKFETKYNIILPVGPDNTVICASCQNPHQQGVILSESACKGSGERYRLRVGDVWALCTACHGGRY